MKNIKLFLLLFILASLSLNSCKKDVNKSDNKVVPDLNNRYISSIIIDESNIRWIGTDTGLFKSVANGYMLEDIIPGNIISLGYEKDSKTIWIGTNEGLLKASIGTTEFTSSSIASSNLSNSSINVTYIDPELKRWFGTNVGITMNKSDTYKKANFIYNVLGYLVPLDIEDTKVNSIASWDGDFYFATSGKAIYRAYNFNDSVDAFTGASQLSVPYNGNAISDTMFIVFVDSKGNQWMGGTNGIQVHSGHNSKSNNITYSSKLPNLHVHSIAEAPSGNIWVGTENGIAIFDGSTWTNNSTILPDPFITAIAFDADGSAWVGTKKGLVNIK